MPRRTRSSTSTPRPSCSALYAVAALALSVLVVYRTHADDASAAVHMCDLQTFRANDMAAAQAVKTAPVVLTDWEGMPRTWQHTSFMRTFADFSHPMPTRDADTGGAPRTEGSVSTAGYMGASAAVGGRSAGLLFMHPTETSDAFFAALQPDWVRPTVISRLLEGSATTPTTFFSAMNASLNASHMLHAHEAAWQGLATGTKRWFFLPDTRALPRRADLERGRDVCRADWGAMRDEAEGGRWLQCVQRPGEVVWFRRDWWHATCALDEWTVGIGEQVPYFAGESDRGPAPQAWERIWEEYAKL